MLQVYAYAKCSTCRKALQWLRERGHAFDEIPIVERPPSVEALARIQSLAEVPVRKLFNTSGQSYRAGGWKARLASVSDDEARAALAADGKLIKRPLVIGPNFALIGFKEPDYAAALGE
jgi:arsenate reductase